MTFRQSRLACLAVALPGLLAIAMFTGDSRVASAWLALAGLSWWLACSHARSSSIPARWIWGIALAMRLSALSVGPRFSDDIQRYVWEGEVVLAGHSPYASAPDAAELAPVRERFPLLAAQVNHPEVPASYPPLVQACGVLAALVDRLVPGSAGQAGLGVLRLGFVAADLVLLALILSAARRGRLRPEAGIVWGWCPLVCLEFAGSGHLDSLGILWLALALLAIDGTSLRGSVWTGLGIATKFLPALLLPWIWRAGTGWRRWARPVLALFIGLIGFLPFASLEGGESGITAGVQQYAERWEASSLCYRFVEPIVREHLVAPDAPHERARHLARVLLGCVWLSFALWTVVRVADPWRGCGRLIGAFLVLSPTLHPWYLLWMLPFLARRACAGWSWMIALGGLWYWPLDGWKQAGTWHEPAWLWWTIVPAFASLCAWDYLQGPGRSQRETL